MPFSGVETLEDLKRQAYLSPRPPDLLFMGTSEEIACLAALSSGAESWIGPLGRDLLPISFIAVDSRVDKLGA